MSDLRERVAIEIAASDNDLRTRLQPMTSQVEWNRLSPSLQSQYLRNADAAITAVIEALAAEAEDKSLYIADLFRPNSDFIAMPLADWIRAHLDAGRDGEAGR